MAYNDGAYDPAYQPTIDDKYLLKVHNLVYHRAKWSDPIDSIAALRVPMLRSYFVHYIADIVDLYQIAPKSSDTKDDTQRYEGILSEICEVLRSADSDYMYHGKYAARIYHSSHRYKRLHTLFNLK